MAASSDNGTCEEVSKEEGSQYCLPLPCMCPIPWRGAGGMVGNAVGLLEMEKNRERRQESAGVEIRSFAVRET